MNVEDGVGQAPRPELLELRRSGGLRILGLFLGQDLNAEARSDRDHVFDVLSTEFERLCISVGKILARRGKEFLNPRGKGALQQHRLSRSRVPEMVGNLPGGENEATLLQDGDRVPNVECHFSRQNEERLVLPVMQMRGRAASGRQQRFHHSVLMVGVVSLQEDCHAITGD